MKSIGVEDETHKMFKQMSEKTGVKIKNLIHIAGVRLREQMTRRGKRLGIFK